MSPSKTTKSSSQSKISLTNPSIPLNSLILVTGCNGLLASHVADQLLAAGYRVRGTVRNPDKCSYLTSLYSHRHGGPGKFELVEISDVTAPNAWDDAVKGVAGIVHCVGATDLTIQESDSAAQEELEWQVGLLEAARRAGTVKSFVFTSSAWALWMPDASKKVTLTEQSWNEDAVALARDKNVDPKTKGMAGFMALKTLVEQGIWEWVKREKPGFAFNTVLLDTVLGECLDPKNQGIPSTLGMVHWIWENKHMAIIDLMEPQWFVDCVDMAKVYVAALASSPKVDRERLFVFGERYSFGEVARLLGEMFPERTEKFGKPKKEGWDQTEVPNQRAEELLKRVGQKKGWTGLKESVRANAESILRLEREGGTGAPQSTYAR
ncbi:NAD(P)-binding protein [Neurospora crassa]|uniref:NAD-dependent epimerase/dehydratase domain-containing protein n=2 Tax=Neurospora crassa TaxID=5141 RepID=Q1K5V0_NEUCR|nr:hypothetical protein NCU07195 [Neurospora crassa OR74A]EAA28184.1 hypothetical protein NCU07195 [Neurospora crassa OR74A]KHE85774.1 NAD(P)-binding protein [Neurospora crassa]CAD71087.1 related to aldehyde reductase II [Neurospora crassa]|eukprot:XP_957420.1 hypothetical protein NCU07195 [Neurospora crassa OR74A]